MIQTESNRNFVQTESAIVIERSKIQTSPAILIEGSKNPIQTDPGKIIVQPA